MIARNGFLGGSQPGLPSPHWACGSDGGSQPVAARGRESGWQRHMSSGGSQPNADTIDHNGFLGGSQPRVAVATLDPQRFHE
jgi:hypothetical protein